MVLGVPGKTCNNMVYGELRRFPLETYIKKRAIGFWARILANKETKISRIIYNHTRPYLLTITTSATGLNSLKEYYRTVMWTIYGNHNSLISWLAQSSCREETKIQFH